MSASDYAILIGILAAGALVMVIGAFSEPLDRSYVSPAMIAMAAGMIAGPLVARVLHSSGSAFQYLVLEEFSRIALAIGLIGTALQLPRWDVLHRWRTVGVLIGLVMPAMGVIGGMLAYWLLGVPILTGLLIGAIVMPTDPVLARSVAEGGTAEKNVAERLRNSILGESGLNDGLAFPFVTLLAGVVHVPRTAIADWVLHDLLWGVLAAAVLGVLVGSGAGLLFRWSERRGYVEETFAATHPIALALLTVSTVRLLGMDGILAVFIAGLAFAIVRKDRDPSGDRYTAATDRFFSIPFFFLFGLSIPWGAWYGMGWRGLALVAAVLLFRRLPAVLLLRHTMRDQVHNWAEAAFLGWFGPIGVSGVFYAMLAVRYDRASQVWGPVSLVVFASVIAFGVTAMPLSRWVGRRSTDG